MNDTLLPALLHGASHDQLVPTKWPSEADMADGLWAADDLHGVNFEVGQRRPPGGGGLIVSCRSHRPLPST